MTLYSTAGARIKPRLWPTGNPLRNYLLTSVADKDANVSVAIELPRTPFHFASTVC